MKKTVKKIDRHGHEEIWEWEETPELIAAVKQLGKSTQDTAHKLAELKLKRPHERQINNG